MVGRPRARTQIVPAQDVLDNQTIHTEKWALFQTYLGRISMEELPPE